MRWLMGIWLCMAGSISAADSAVLEATDLCAPCNGGEQCSSGLCLIDDTTQTGVCTQKCTTTGTVPCPSGFLCTTSTGSAYSHCNPNDDAVCPSIYSGAKLNDLCVFPASTSADANTAFNRDCLENLVCLEFPTGYAACLNECSSLDPNLTCPKAQNCCFGLDANGYCLASSSSTNVGGCIEIQEIGDTCAEADQSVCVQGAGCFTPGGTFTAAASKCYALCPGGTCSNGSICVTIDDVAVCCDAAQYSVNDASTCVPLPGSCKLQVGVACTLNADCRQNYCLKHNNASACSVTCENDDDCPAVDEDVNDDGVADGGGSCLSLNVGKYCWPNTTPALQPNCFTQAATAAAAAAATNSGCNCQSAAADPMWSMGLGGWAFYRIGYRWFRRRRP